MKIGLRIPGTARQLPFTDFCQWCADNGFEAVDIGEVTPEIVKTARDAGLAIGTADLPGVRELLSAKKSKQKAGAIRREEPLSKPPQTTTCISCSASLCRRMRASVKRQKL